MTSVGVVGDSGPVSSPHATKVTAANATPPNERSFLYILVVPLEDDPPVLLPADGGRIWSCGCILARAAHPASLARDTLSHEILANRARAIEPDHDVRCVGSHIIG